MYISFNSLCICLQNSLLAYASVELIRFRAEYVYEKAHRGKGRGSELARASVVWNVCAFTQTKVLVSPSCQLLYSVKELGMPAESRFDLLKTHFVARNLSRRKVIQISHDDVTWKQVRQHR